MSFIEIDLNGVAEPKPVPAGRYNLVVSNATHRPEKNDIRVSLAFEGVPNAANLVHFISLPGEDDDEGLVYFKKRMLKRFLRQFGIPNDGSGFNVSDMVGARGNAQVTLSEPDESGAVYNRLVLDRFE